MKYLNIKANLQLRVKERSYMRLWYEFLLYFIKEKYYVRALTVEIRLCYRPPSAMLVCYVGCLSSA
jgi:hypothetical protein